MRKGHHRMGWATSVAFTIAGWLMGQLFSCRWPAKGNLQSKAPLPTLPTPTPLHTHPFHDPSPNTSPRKVPHKANLQSFPWPQPHPGSRQPRRHRWDTLWPGRWPDLLHRSLPGTETGARGMEIGARGAETGARGTTGETWVGNGVAGRCKQELGCSASPAVLLTTVTCWNTTEAFPMLAPDVMDA